MAATLTGSGELLYASFPIDKVETDADGDLIVFGKASDGSVDSDQQVVAPSWMRNAAQAWKESGANLRVQHNAQRDPAGIGLEVETDASGATWVKGLVIEPIAKRLVAKGALRAYSVGIAHPTIERDPTGKARGGIITGGELVEISLVDRPANKRCGIQLVKSADDGTPEYVGKVFGADDAIAKALGEPGIVKGGDGAEADDLVSVDLPSTMALSVSPRDLAKMNTLSRQHAVRGHYDDLALKAIADAEAAIYKRDIDTATRRRLAAEGKALPNLSYPVENSGDLQNAATLARSGHGDVAAARRLIARRAKELGVANPLDEDDKVKKGGSEEGVTLAEPAAEKAGGALDDKALAALKALQDLMLAAPVPADEPAAVKADAPGAAEAAVPDVTKEPDGKDAPVKKAKGKPKGPKKMPPWLNKPGDGDGGDGDSDDASKACKSFLDHTWIGTDATRSTDVECSKCHTTPAQAAGVTASPMDPAPVGDLLESSPPASVKGATPQSASGAKDAAAMKPVPAHREPDGAEIESFEKDSGMSDGDSEGPTRLEAPTLKASPEVSALLRFRAVGIDPELGKLHDLTCPAYHPDEVAKFHPFADLASLIDEGTWQRKSLEAACGPIEHAIAMHELMQSALALKAASEADVNDWRLAAHKAFRDANPGPATYPSPGAVSPQKYNRPLITDGHAAPSTGHAGPNTSPVVATTAPNAQSFDRPPLSAAHASPSPSFMKASWEYPAQQGVPVQLNYAHLEKDRQRQALARVHEHLSRQFPEACPIDMDRPAQQAENHPVPATAGIGKGGNDSTGTVQVITKSAASFKAEPETGDSFFADADVYKGFKKMRKKLGKKVLSGDMTVDEARAKMGRRFAQKGAGDEQDTAQKAATATAPALPLAAADLPALVKAAVAEALPQPVAPEPATIASFDMGPSVEAAVTKAMAPLLEKIRQQDETYTAKLAEQQRVIDAIADQPDPSTASFAGVAFSPVRKAARPAGVTDIAESAARARMAVVRELENTVNSASDPYEREAARASLDRIRGGGA